MLQRGRSDGGCVLFGKIARAIYQRTIGPAVERKIQQWKAPYMVHGYRAPDGTLCPRTRISDTVYFYHRDRIVIEDNVFIWHYSILDGSGGLEIGEGCQIGAWAGIFTHSSHIAIRLYGGHYREFGEDEKQGYVLSPVQIGKYSFIGSGAKILPGVRIGAGCVVTPGSIVAHSFPDFSVISGNPARRMGDTRDMDREYLAADPQLEAWYREWADTVPVPEPIRAASARAGSSH